MIVSFRTSMSIGIENPYQENRVRRFAAKIRIDERLL
ncbi:MAG: hypothetical protein ACI8TL_001196 [Natronomonas sp.]|jgi:hypothetical protein